MIGFSGLNEPTAEQTRFMAQYTGEKPHLKVWRDGWRCIGRGFDILGETPEKAYANWKCYAEVAK